MHSTIFKNYTIFKNDVYKVFYYNIIILTYYYDIVYEERTESKAGYI